VANDKQGMSNQSFLTLFNFPDKLIKVDLNKESLLKSLSTTIIFNNLKIGC